MRPTTVKFLATASVAEPLTASISVNEGKGYAGKQEGGGHVLRGVRDSGNPDVRQVMDYEETRWSSIRYEKSGRV